MKVGFMGGTFDPIHIGHMLAAESAREACGLDEVWFIPAGQPPLKENGPVADGQTRLEMVYRAIDFQPHFRAMDVELDSDGKSYTINTIKMLHEQYPGREFSIIIGTDRVNDLAQWHEIERLAEMVRFIGMTRGGQDMKVDNLPAFLRDRLTIVEMPQIKLSSTDVRDRRAQGRSIRFLVPEKVYSFITRNGLYESQ
ncbi:nicotinate-nucleotide adenylyltransferase [Paenibacillus montanisoli]|uniref:Probable nicotinate-nucleotide adenylyltransferase n=1 Tax=Paenibacillus montanisoli TaxID=2081970 RepID=A0A328U555_9BACL|nr:nicotinate-nucleotide adenylyltransferase [Paenibacillus montanisoli]